MIEHRYCDDCGIQQDVAAEFDTTICYPGFIPEQVRPVHVVALDCGHDIVTELKR